MVRPVYLPHEQAQAEAVRAVLEALAIKQSKQMKPLQFERLPFYPKQAEPINDPHRFTVTEATPKAGKTMSHLEWLLDEGIRENEGNSYWVATVKSVSKMAYRRALDRLRGYIDSCGERKKVADPVPFRKHETELWIMVGGHTFWFKSADEPDSLYGDDVRRAVGDEYTRWREPAYNALYSTLLATRGRLKLIGNVKGRRNWGYKLARKAEAEAGAGDWGFHRLTAYDAVEGGILDRDIVDQAQRDLPENVFRELMLAQASTDEGNPFGLSAIERQTLPGLSDGATVAWGWDLAKSKDWTVGIGLDRRGAASRFERWNKTELPPGLTAETEYWEATENRIRDLTGSVSALVDSTGNGDSVFERIAKGRPSIRPYLFTAPSKQRLMEGLAVALQQGRVWFPDGPIRAELEAFEYVYTRTGIHYSAPEGMHDDCVCALALAVACQGIPSGSISSAEEIVVDEPEEAIPSWA